MVNVNMLKAKIIEKNIEKKYDSNYGCSNDDESCSMW